MELRTGLGLGCRDRAKLNYGVADLTVAEMTDAQLEAQTSPAAAVDNADVPGNATSSGVDGSAAAVPSEDLPLQEPWTLWYDAPSKTKPVVWGESLVQVHTFDSIGGFWSLFNNLVPP